MTGLRISELAATTGFPAATLRYYETVGLLTPQRDPNGYRRYTAADTDRLRFVARAKQLGLSLEEIAELVELRGDGHCPPVRSRLAGLVVDKLAETHRSIDELTGFAAELARLAEAIETTEAPEVCGRGCGCPDQPRTIDAPSSLPISCTLNGAEQADREGDWRTLIATARVSAPAAGGWRLEFPADPPVVARVAALAAAEHQCCAFLTFTLQVAGDALTLEVSAPPQAQPLVVELFGPGTDVVTTVA
jgi:DNA-binding transcriptional MerR regulator